MCFPLTRQQKIFLCQICLCCQRQESFTTAIINCILSIFPLLSTTSFNCIIFIIQSIFNCWFLAGQMFLMNRFFDGAFLTFGIRVIEFMESDQEDRIDPLILVFPKMTKCTFYKFGVSGNVEMHDAICILPLNVVNEKIYVFLWFWFIILSLLTFITIVYRFIIILSPRMRVYLLRMRYRLIKKDDIDLLVRKSKMGDWFLFYMLGENVDSLIFRDVIHELAHKLRNHQFQDCSRGFKDIHQEP